MSETETIQRMLGCEGCFFCDSKSLFKRAACTYIGYIIQDEDGKCLVRKGAGRA